MSLDGLLDNIVNEYLQLQLHPHDTSEVSHGQRVYRHVGLQNVHCNV
jgi:hypothetical protein